MKRYLYSVLGTLTGIWLSVILGFILLLVIIASASADDTDLSVKDNSVLKVTFAGTAVDRSEPVNPLARLYGMGEDVFAVNTVVKGIDDAAADPRIAGMLLDFQGVSMGLAQAEMVRDAIKRFSDSGKWVMAYGDTYTQTEYYVASAADEIFLNQIGMVDIHGLSATTVYFKDFLDKLGVEAQVVKVGTYKSAVEPFILNEMSEANREQQELFLKNIWGTMAKELADRRHVTVDSVDVWANGFSFAQEPEFYSRNGIVDGLCYRHDIDEEIAARTGYDDPEYVDCVKYASGDISVSEAGANIAVLYALGDITESGEEGITSDAMVPVILDLAKNDDIDGLVLRVNSGGGSAFASEQIWEALEQFKEISGKPYYVSMGDMAASGGYYISCGADKIYAEPLTLTGSIGIFGIIPNLEGLMKDKLGINTFTVSTNDGDMPGILKPMSPQLRIAMQNYVNRGYRLFVSRCAKGRGLKYEQVAAVAEGRVWDGASALERGLVDKMGGLYDALDDMCEALHAESYRIVEYPVQKKTVWDMIFSLDTEDLAQSTLRTKLGKTYDYYKTIERFSAMHPLQCRTDFITVE